jgi:LuxR family maltose regulon positive regulatory protein
MARLRAAEGDLSAALELLDEAERLYVGDYSPNVQPVHATRARVLAVKGDVAQARAWARQHAVSTEDELSYLREYEHLTLARVLLAEHGQTGSRATLQEAVAFLDRLLAAATAGGRVGTMIELEVLRAIAHQRSGEAATALDALARAVELAEADGWVRVFVDAGRTLRDLLPALVLRQPESAFTRELLAAVTAAGTVLELSGARHSDAVETPVPAPRPRAELIDPLSDRELDVLRLLGSDLDGPAIARELVVSLNTVRTHTKHIYTKLGVNNRRAAISKAHQLDLLSRSRNR